MRTHTLPVRMIDCRQDALLGPDIDGGGIVRDMAALQGSAAFRIITPGSNQPRARMIFQGQPENHRDGGSAAGFSTGFLGRGDSKPWPHLYKPILAINGYHYYSQGV